MAQSAYRYSNGRYVRKSERQGVNYDEFATECWSLLLSFFRWYPDILEDIVESENKEFSNSLINRVMKRAMAREQEVFVTGARGLGKTTTVVSDKCNKGILWPGEITGYYAPVAVQAAPLASKAFATYKRNTPILADHYIKNNDSKAVFKVSTPLGSQFIMDIDRGIDTSGVIAEECAQEDRNPFNWADFNQIVLGTNRLSYKVNGHEDPTHIDSQIHYITSATRRENEAYSVYTNVRKSMLNGDSAFAVSIPWQVPVLSRMKSFSYYQMLKKRLTSEQFMRECDSKWTGSIENPIIRDDILTASRKLKVMEEKHCGDPECFYIIGYDVSSRDVSNNAMTAMAVIKCERQHHGAVMDEYRKSLIYVEDRKPPKNAREHAAIIKRRWKDYCIEDGRPAFVVVDARSYGLSVIEHLHEDLGDGLPPMRTMNNDPTFAMLVKDNAVPCLYALQASGSSGADPNTVMLDYIEREFENGNLRLLTQNLYEGLQAYKLKHDIKDDLRDAEIQLPYSATNRLARQISNLQKKYGAVGWTEQQINKYIQKDMWSALLYACRIAQRLEKSELYALNRRKNEWDELAKKYEGMTGDYAPSHYNKKRRSGRLAVKR
jgi:hypothetical protein